MARAGRPGTVPLHGRVASSVPWSLSRCCSRRVRGGRPAAGRPRAPPGAPPRPRRVRAGRRTAPTRRSNAFTVQLRTIRFVCAVRLADGGLRLVAGRSPRPRPRDLRASTARCRLHAACLTGRDRCNEVVTGSSRSRGEGHAGDRRYPRRHALPSARSSSDSTAGSACASSRARTRRGAAASPARSSSRGCSSTTSASAATPCGRSRR